MKKALPLLIFLFLSSISLFAQTDFRFADSTAQWNVLRVGGVTGPIKQTIIINAGVDTVITDRSYQLIGKSCLRRDSLQRIFLFAFYDSSETLLYDFGKSTNELISNIGTLHTFCYVDSTDSVFIGHFRKRMYIRYGSDSASLAISHPLDFSDVWVDGIGSIYNYFLDTESGIKIPEAPLDTLLCYFENSQLLYHDFHYDTCYINTTLQSEQTDFRFADSTAQWKIVNRDLSFNSVNTGIYTVQGDTIIADSAYQHIGFSFVRQVLGKVFLRNNPTDILIYDFSKAKGDTFALTQFSDVIPDLRCAMDSTDSIQLDGMRKRMFVTYFSATVSFSTDTPVELYSDKDIWIEGIGATLTHFLSPGLNSRWIGGSDVSLLCFSEKGQTLYTNTLYNTCDTNTVVGINQILNQNNVQLFPNPVSENYASIQFSETPVDKTTFQLFDLTGRMILQKLLTEKLNQIQLPDVAKGMYLYTIVSGDKNYSGKLVVQ